MDDLKLAHVPVRIGTEDEIDHDVAPATARWLEIALLDTNDFNGGLGPQKLVPGGRNQLLS